MARKNNKKKEPLPKIGKRRVKSVFEFEGFKAIKGLLPKGAVAGYEDEKLEYQTTSMYTPDVLVEFKDGRKMYVEFKGYFKYADRAKMQAVKESHPDLDIRMIFQRNSPSCLGKGSKMRPSEWAEKYGFPYAIGEIPVEWFRDDIETQEQQLEQSSD